MCLNEDQAYCVTFYWQVCVVTIPIMTMTKTLSDVLQWAFDCQATVFTVNPLKVVVIHSDEEPTL